jgi:hypothetical protein
VLDNHRAGLGWITITLVLFISLGQTSLAQSSADQKKTLTLAEAVDFALKNYPAVRASSSEYEMGRRNGWMWSQV